MAAAAALPLRSLERIGVVLQPERDGAAVVDAVVGWARRRGATVLLPDVPLEERAAESGVIVAAGGDGTLLHAMRLAALHRVPLLGVNLGRLGYLAAVEADEVEAALDAIAAGDYTLERRRALRLSIWGRPTALAFNDVVIRRFPGSAPAQVALRVDGELFTRHSGDGLVVSTATGSTGYSFSAGGPIVSPRLQTILITPLAAHSPLQRSLVLSAGEVVELDVLRGGRGLSLEVDGEQHPGIAAGTQLRVGAGAAAADVVRPGHVGFVAHVRRKLRLVDPPELTTALEEVPR
jgi:NAD+ kinase